MISVPTTAEDRQTAQADMLREAMKIPGVAELVEVYDQLAPYAALAQYSTAGFALYATGGNA